MDIPAFGRLLEKIKTGNPFLNAAAQGMAPGEIKAAIISKLGPYIANRGILDALAVELLAPEAVRISIVEGDKWSFELFERTRAVYERSKNVNHTQCFAAFRSWQAEVFHGLSRFWSVYQLVEHVDKTSISFEDSVFEDFRNIGVLLERGIQPCIRELLEHVRLEADKPVRKTVRELDFGQVVSELIDSRTISAALAPAPWNVRISQWRNVAQHQSFSVNGSQIVVTYGKVHKQSRVCLNANDIPALLHRVSGIFNALHAARTMFAIDNYTDFTNAVGPVQIRDEAHVVHLATSFATQGFELVSLNPQDDGVVAEIKDIAGGNPIHRASHVSQFSHSIWRCFPRRVVRIRFRSASDEMCAVLSTNGSDFESYENGLIEFEELANRFKIEFE